jgi:hypothetical protein
MKVTVHRSASRGHGILKMAHDACAIFGAVALGLSAFAYFQARVFQAQEGSHFEAAPARKDLRRLFGCARRRVLR